MITESTRPLGFAEQETKSTAQPPTSVLSGANLTLRGETFFRVCRLITHFFILLFPCAFFSQNNNVKQAKQAFETYINSVPSPPKDQYLIRSYFGLGEVYCAEGSQLKGSVSSFSCFSTISSRLYLFIDVTFISTITKHHFRK